MQSFVINTKTLNNIMLQYSTVPQYSDIVQYSIVNTFIMYTLQYSTVQYTL